MYLRVIDYLVLCFLFLVNINKQVGASEGEWIDGKDGRSKWQYNCDYTDQEIALIRVPIKEECANVCLANPKCNYFSHHHGFCYLKNIPEWIPEPESSLAGICGYLPERIVFLCDQEVDYSPCECLIRLYDNTTIFNCQNRHLIQFPVHLPFDQESNSIQLNLSNNRIDLTQLTQNIVSNQSFASVNYLDVSHNAINSSIIFDPSWIFHFKNSFPNLCHLDLSNNNLTRISKEAVDQWNENLTFSLAGNPWKCHCSNLVTAEFFSTFESRIRDFREIKCEGNETTIRTFKTGAGCDATVDPIFLYYSIASLLTLFIVVLLVTFTFCYKDVVIFWLRQHGFCECPSLKEDNKEEEREYDAFISFSHKDEDFVTRELIPQLEKPGENGLPEYRLCLHFRDW